jgi:uncharacterized RDD family membrane protein YckC
MKCPKCDYLGFETGDRCRNCGYDFSLLAHDAPVPDLSLRPPQPPEPELPPLPLFARAGADDEPLIKLPAAPRAPLAVRRTPEQQRPRTVARPLRPVQRSPADRNIRAEREADRGVPLHDPQDERGGGEPELALQFIPDPLDAAPPAPRIQGRAAQVRPAAPDTRAASPVVRRVAAAAIDLAILLTIDLAVVYFTLRMAALTMSDWPMLPAVPMAAFLAILKLAYFSAFTSIGGQTIGKMAARIQVVADDETPLDPARAIRRVFAGALSTLAFGLGFIPALIGPDRRPLHDRVARTRVVARSS